MQESEDWEPRAPQNYFIHLLDIQHSKNKDKLIENKVPELVLNVLQHKKVIYIVKHPVSAYAH